MTVRRDSQLTTTVHDTTVHGDTTVTADHDQSWRYERPGGVG
jgi:hypothetical protein